MYKRDYSTFDQQALISELQSINWQVSFIDHNPSAMFNSFYKEISSIIDRHVPIKQLSRKELKVRSKAWITPAMRKSIQIKNNLYKKYIKSKSTHYHIRFKLYRNKINHLLKMSKKRYHNRYFLDNITDGKKIWKGIKQIVHFKPNTNKKTCKDYGQQ